MMEWTEYISYLLNAWDNSDNLSISLDGGETETEIPPIIKTSIYMLDKMIEKQGRLNVFVFPEKVQLIFIFILMKLFHNISVGKIKSNYDPTSFQPGEKLKVGNAVVEYLGMVEFEGDTYVSIRLADADSFCILPSYLPVFQKVTTKRKLSKIAQFVAAREKALSARNDVLSGGPKLSFVADMKTHMDSSVFVMTSITGVKEQLGKCFIERKKATDIFYIGQSDYKGEISNISSGQMTGIPAIVFASDLYSIHAAVTNGNPIQSIIIDSSNINALLNQLDVLDELIKLNVPIVCVSDIANSFDLDSLAVRNFNVWRWDKDSITPQLYDMLPLTSDKKTKNYVEQHITYMKADGAEISEAMRLLSLHRREIEKYSLQLMRLYERLNSLTFKALRTTTPLKSIDCDEANRTLDDCLLTIHGEYAYITEATANDYQTIIKCLRKVYSQGYVFKKNEMLQKYLSEHNSESVYLVVPEKSSRTQIQDYWTTWCINNSISGSVKVLYPSEYYMLSLGDVKITFICGWLKRAIMRKIIFSFNTANYIVFLYDYENRWQKHDTKRWEKALDSSGNKSIIEKSFSTDQTMISNVRYDKKTYTPEMPDFPDELGEIELILRENKYRQYTQNGNRSGSGIVNAIPVNFVGGYLSFYRTGHSIISATKIILSDAEKIEMVFPSDLHVGDFIVVRESDKDLVKDLADIILKNSGKEHLREIASKWREALKIELLFCTVEEFCEKMQEAGCDKGLATIRRWIEDDDVIAPRSKKDLQILAKLTENETLIEMLDSIYEAAQEVRSAHVLAGRKLSEQLRMTLARELRQFGGIDPFNFWEPIEMEIEGIGTVKILKIIDIGSEVEVDPADTNRLIAE